MCTVGPSSLSKNIWGLLTAGLACLPSQACLGTGSLLALFAKRSVSTPTVMQLVATGSRGFQQNQFLCS